MRLRLIGVWFPLTVQGSVHGDACNFVGFRLAKVPSHCIEGHCSEITVEERDGKIVPIMWSEGLGRALSCEGAKEIAREILTENGAYVRKRKLEDESAILGESLFPAVEKAVAKLVMTNEALDESTINSMNEIDALLLKVFAKGDAEWTELNEYLHSLSSFSGLMREHSVELLAFTMTNPSSVDILTGTTAPALHFLMDLWSMFGVPEGMVFDRRSQLACIQVLSVNPVRHRQVFRQERAMTLEQSRDRTSTNVLRLAEAMTQMTVGIPVHAHHLLGLIRFVSTLSLSSQSVSTADGLLLFQFQTEVCPQLISVLTQNPFLADSVKVGITLIHVCRAFTSLETRLSASIALSKRIFQECPILAVDEAAQAIVDRLATPTPFVGALKFDQPVSDVTAGLIVRDTLTRLLGRASSAPRNSESASRSLGQALGLAVMFNIPFMRILRTDRMKVLAIHRDLPGISGQSRKNLLHIRTGIRDIIGEAGIYALSEAEWDDLVKSV
jgi:hypothetical protein